MKKYLERILKIDPLLVLAVAIISSIGLASIYSSQGASVAIRQGIFLAVGIVIFLSFSFFDWRTFKENSVLVFSFYLLTVLLLGGLFYFAPTIRNVQRWYRIGPFLFDPASFAMLALIILLAKYFSERHVELYKIRHIVLSGVYAFIPTYLVFRQPDMGSALIFLVLWGGILIISGIRLKHFLALCLVGLVSLGLVWGFVMQDYQKDRVMSFVEPDLDPQDIGWGGAQARKAIGNGGLWGQGLKEGSQTQYGFLPEPHTDFIFAAIGEEMGFVGITALISGLALLIWRSIKVAFKAADNFPRLFVSGFLIVFMFQAFVNIGMNLGLLPIMGTPLPLVSYGGSTIVFVFICLGILENMRYTTG